jgi:L-cysteine:1D-myo-inositol 2-amino-2-deoxy-alpha-D-glucopyranoside ligase
MAAVWLRVRDTLTGALVPLPVSRGAEDGAEELKLYVCGITPYDSGHLGHAFTFASFDLLARWVEAQGVRVRYVQNVTDVDDPLFERARRDGVAWDALAEREIKGFAAEMRAIGCRTPDFMPRVSDEIPGILDAVRTLAARGFAYPADALYFDVSKYRRFGELSHRSRRSMLRKLRDEKLLGELGPGRKRDYLDFPLWRGSLPDEPAWESEFGAGRPGWHIECSTMAMRYLGPVVDVHGGGRDLVFSHHESERAQSESLTGEVPFARAWLHTGMVRYEGHKMSKSLGNLVNVRQCLERPGVAAAAVRLLLASHHYRSDWSFTWEALDRAAALAERCRTLVGEARGAGAPAGPKRARERGGWEGSVFQREFAEALNDDLDTPRALRVLRRALSAADADAVAAMLGILCGTASLEPAGALAAS